MLFAQVALLMTATAAPPGDFSSTYCASNYGTGYVEFSATAGIAVLYLDGTGQFDGGLALDLDLPCAPDSSRADRAAWVCVERRPYANPDGPTSVAVETSGDYLLMVATRESRKYHGQIVVDDFDCLAGKPRS